MSIEDLKARYAEPQTNGTPMETESQGSETEGKYYTSSMDLNNFILLHLYSVSSSLKARSHGIEILRKTMNNV